MKLKFFTVFSAAMVGLTLLSDIAFGKTFSYKPLQLLTRDNQSGPCPEKVLSYETSRPFQEGSYSIDGQVSLTEIASNISLAKRDEFSATWIGDLKSQFRNCRASAGITTVDGEPYQGHSYMRLQFIKGKVYFILDMTGNRDANNYTTNILSVTLKDNNPRWNWGGSD